MQCERKMDEDNRIMLRKKEIRQRGWSKKMTKELLPEPDGADEKTPLWALETVEELEAEPRIAELITKTKQSWLSSGSIAGQPPPRGLKGGISKTRRRNWKRNEAQRDRENIERQRRLMESRPPTSAEKHREMVEETEAYGRIMRQKPDPGTSI